MEIGNNQDMHSKLAAIIGSSDDARLNNSLEGIILSNIINHSDDAIISKTPQGIITSWNRGAEKIFGYTRNEVVGKHISILIPDDRTGEETEIIGKVMLGELVDHYETERCRKDGSIISISLTVSPLKDSSGKIIGISKIARDITARKKLQEVQTRMSDIINFSDDAIISRTLEGIVTSWNRAAEKIFGYAESEMVGSSISILFPESHKDDEPKIVAMISSGESVQHYQTERIRKDGTRVLISLTLSPIKNTKGEVIGISKIARDITDRKRIEEEIILKNKELESFSYSVSHDLQAPLRRILHYAESLEEDYHDQLDEDGKKLISRISKNSLKMQQLINDLLAFSQLGRQEVVKSNVDMAQLTHAVVEELIPETQKVKVEIETLKSVRGDRNLLKQVIENLVSNAVKYSGKKDQPQITIGSEKKGREYTFFIRDNGVGFDMRYSEKLFNVFQRLHHVNDFEGSGVGLAIVKQIISKHGGKVWAKAAPDEGATFYFSIPE
jgi:PAS domain S-box-containing protein